MRDLPNPTPRRSRAALLIASLLLAAALAACGNGGDRLAGPEAPVSITGVQATSGTTVRVSYSGPVGESAEAPGNYVISGDAGDLTVLAAHRSAPDVVLLATDRQEPEAEYRLALRSVRAAGGSAVVQDDPATLAFRGSDVPAPVLASAVPLSNTEVLLTFVEPDGHRPVTLKNTARNAHFYRIEPHLPVTGVEMAFPNFVKLTTAPQEDREYVVTVTNVEDMAGRLIDHRAARGTFSGVPADDQQPPRVVKAVALGHQTVQLQFSEPVRDDAAAITNYAIEGANGQPLAVEEVTLDRPYNTVVTLTTHPQTDGLAYTVTVTGVTDRNGNPMDPAGSVVRFDGVGPLLDGPPQLLSAGATSNRSVLLTFDKPLDQADVVVTSNYTIRAHDGGASVLNVVSASPLTPSTVELQTGSQSAIRYVVEVVGVRDQQGNHLRPSTDGEPAFAVFTGVAPSAGDLVDTDGDGLTDAEELRGWTVTITLSDGTVEQYHVTSDPSAVDTDGDGVPDLEEKRLRTDPRSADTDTDGLSDRMEVDFFFTDPRRQDTDDDGLIDGLEVNFFRTSPLHADTDGDQFADGDEVRLAGRSPVLADLPRISIEIGDVHLTLDERYSYTDAHGESQVVETSSSTTLEQGTERSHSTSDTTTLANSLSFNESLTVGGEYSFPGFGVKAEVTVGSEQSQSDEYSSTVSEQSAVRSNRTYNESVARGSTFEASSSVTREVYGASMQLALNLGSTSDVPFSVTNLEVTALWQDPVEPTRLVPIASLVPSTQLESGAAPVYNLGPFVPTIGPLVFDNRTVFPKTLEELMRSPRGLVFKVANYDMQDEEGRNFAFSSLDTFDRTAGLTIDYGDGTVDRHRIATSVARLAPYADTNGDGRIDLHCGIAGGDTCDNNGDGTVDDRDRIAFDVHGRPVGRTMKDALELLGVDYEVRDVDYDDHAVEVLFRIGSLENRPETHQAWVLFVTDATRGGNRNPQVLDETDFEEIVLRPGVSYQIAYLQDRDEDQLFAHEEYLHGSRDDAVNSDNHADGNSLECRAADSPHGLPDGYPFDFFQLPENAGAALPLPRLTFTCDTLTDYEEVREGWLVRVRGATAYRAYPSPRLADSDGDGIPDHVEKSLGTDPMKRDTDGDGISDFDEIYGFSMRFRGDFSFTDVVEKFCPAMISGGACDPADAAYFVTDPLDPDTDGDGIPDGAELGIGANPRFADAADFIDTDRDGLSDALEDRIGSSKYEADTDGDGLPDLLEYMIGSNPLLADSDRDGLSDYHELDIYTFGSLPGRDFDVDQFLRECGSVAYNATACSYTPPSGANLPHGTDPTRADTDGDGIDDDVELELSWAVAVFGQAPYEVTPDPTQADADGDGLNDLEEMLAGTDPFQRDTDGDGKPDSDDPHPLRRDHQITFHYTSITVDGDCEDGQGGHDDWIGTLNISHPGGTRTMWNLRRKGEGDGPIDNVGEGSTVDLDDVAVRRERFTLLDGQEFRVFSSNIEEWDGGSGNEDLGSFSHTYGYSQVPTNGTAVLDSPGNDHCGLTIRWTIATN